MSTAVIKDKSIRGTALEALPRRPVSRGRAMKLVHLLWVGGLALAPSLAMAEGALDSGDTAWMLTATALVLFMTVPGLALFYAGMVRSKNVLSVLMQCSPSPR